ncbi:MAG: DEAD/DEAH box helicase [Kiritimatiellae bacterium]|nr:DEAD/DEAH box helicase [Kiritimatiellia bacterium]
MILLHLEIDETGQGIFSPDTPSPLLLEAVQSVVWFKDEADPIGDGRVVTSARNMLMFLSDVRGRKFKRGIFLGDDVLRLAETFRSVARIVAAGQFLPDIEERPDGFHAVWRPINDLKDHKVPKGIKAPQDLEGRLLDLLVRRAGRSPLEGGTGRHETVHDAWLAALRSDSSRLRWPDPDDARELMRQLRTWRAPLAVSAADRAALTFTLVPADAEEAPWRLALSAPPATRMGLVSLGQAASVFPPLRSLRGGSVDLSRAEAESFLRTGASALSAAGYSVAIPDGVAGEHVSAVAELVTAGDATERSQGPAEAAGRPITPKLTIRVDGETVTEQEIEFLLDQGSTLVFFRNRWIEVDRNVLREALRALRATKAKKLSVREATSFALGLGRLGRLRIDEVKAHGWLRGLLNELRGEQAFSILPPPPGLRGTMRDYQLRGYSWLAFLAKWGFGPCLADDMGLGKTVQAIAYMLHAKDEGGRLKAKKLNAGEDDNGNPAVKATLVVAPVSVTTNWTRELKKFAPSLKVMLHQGPDRLIGGSFARACAMADVVVTGYSLLVKDFRLFADASFSALILDEAQMIKNPDTQAARAARALDAPVKVALTGTPLENSANDLWSLEEFLNPGLLGERRDFEAMFTRAIRENAMSGATARLKHILEPFMLRRLKTAPGIASELGPKREIREYCPLSPAQRRRYEDALASYRADVAAADGEPSRGRMLALLTELKLVCDGDGKLARLGDLLEGIFANGESCLVFTQYAKVGRQIRDFLREEFGRTFPFLHGSLPPAEREAEIKAFDADPEPNAFILSLKAGGFGLNLTRATHVIHFDRWWNPAVENQATDRAHRIGQAKTVFVHTFICPGTLEDRIDELLAAKRQLANEVVAGGESFLLKMNPREFERTVSLG